MTDETTDNAPLTPQTLVDILRANGYLNDARVDNAFSRVPRERFLPNTPLEVVYSDASVPVLHNNEGHTTVSSTLPSMIASLLTSAQLQEGLNVLHINTGTGFTAALISQIIGTSGHITSLEMNRELAIKAENTLLRAGFSSVTVVNRDAIEGYAPRAAYDRIISSAGIWDVPLTWKRQLKPDGTITTPIWLDGLQVLATLRQQPDGSLYAENIKPSIFVYLQGKEGVPAFRRRVGSSALTLISDDIERLDLTALHWLLSQDHDLDNHFSHSLRSKEYWYGFLPYIAINEGLEDIFALYSIDPDRTAYGGMSGEGFAYFTPASACFVPYFGIGNAHTFAGSDAFLEVEALINQWEGDKRPGLDQLRIRFIPREAGISADVAGKVYPRSNHFVHAWMEI
jgi:protein-L-isoaspartate(D-aspartate) O-methyltransferase